MTNAFELLLSTMPNLSGLINQAIKEKTEMLTKKVDTLKSENEVLRNTQMSQSLNPDEYYNRLNILATSLDELKKFKLAQLSYLCSLSIYKGFTSSVKGYQFKLDSEDQLNFDLQLNDINSMKIKLITGEIKQDEFNQLFPLNWKTTNMGVVQLTEQDFNIITEEIKQHLLKNKAKYWELEQIVINTDSKKDLELIVW